MPAHATDYLVVGAGASALAFADTLLDQTDAHITLVDRRDAVGGHWNDAYPFVRLHQPSSFYGAASRALGDGRLDTEGLNAGFEELATGQEVLTHFHLLLKDRLLPSGRVTFMPMCEHADGTTVRHLQSGKVEHIEVRRKVVDARLCENQIPLTHTPSYERDNQAKMVPPNTLPQSAAGARHFTILGGGKTAMDTIIWLLQRGVAGARIRWVLPRDAWVINRAFTQPGAAFFFESYGGYASQLECLRSATSLKDLGERMEAAGLWMRLDADVTPAVIRGATLSAPELELLRTVHDVVRLGRVTEIHGDQIVLENGTVSSPPGTLFVDCTASALSRLPVEPVFQPGRIALQMIRLYQPTFSTALIAFIEGRDLDDAARNGLAAPAAMTDDVASWVQSQIVTMTNQYAWSQDAEIAGWIRTCRLDGFGRAGRDVDRTDPEVAAVFDRIKAAAIPALANMQVLVSASAPQG